MGETYLKQVIDKPVSEDGRGPGVVFAASCVQGWRSAQEDAHICLPSFDKSASLWAVFDGHNGAEVAIFAAKRLPKILKTNANYKGGRYELALQEAFMAFDDLLLTRESIRELISIRQSYTNNPIIKANAPGIASGCTAIVVLIKDNVIYAANLGDSRAILCRNGKPFPLSVDNKPDDAGERARVENAGGEVVSGRINMGVNVSRAFGDHSYKRNTGLSKKEQMIVAYPDVKTEPLNRTTDTALVLICDGVWNSVSAEMLIQYVARRMIRVRPLSKVCEEVFAQILPKEMPAHGIIGKDNMTFVIVKFEGSGAAVTTAPTAGVKKIKSNSSTAAQPLGPPGPTAPTTTAPKRTNSKETLFQQKPNPSPKNS
jgi:serine/threonine protein phosphatase PrpC